MKLYVARLPNQVGALELEPHVATRDAANIAMMKSERSEHSYSRSY